VQPPKRISVSFIVDSDPVIAYTGWHLVHSLLEHTPLTPADIHFQCLPDVDGTTMERFAALGCNTHRVARFGDGRFCNKLAQSRICEIVVMITSRILDKCLFFVRIRVSSALFEVPVKRELSNAMRGGSCTL